MAPDRRRGARPGRGASSLAGIAAGSPKSRGKSWKSRDSSSSDGPRLATSSIDSRTVCWTSRCASGQARHPDGRQRVVARQRLAVVAHLVAEAAIHADALGQLPVQRPEPGAHRDRPLGIERRADARDVVDHEGRRVETLDPLDRRRLGPRAGRQGHHQVVGQLAGDPDRGIAGHEVPLDPLPQDRLVHHVEEELRQAGQAEALVAGPHPGHAHREAPASLPGGLGAQDLGLLVHPAEPRGFDLGADVAQELGRVARRSAGHEGHAERLGRAVRVVERIVDRRQDQVLEQVRHAAVDRRLVRLADPEGQGQDRRAGRRDVEERDPVELVVGDLRDVTGVERRRHRRSGIRLGRRGDGRFVHGSPI